jgi:hypothetical protein
MAVATGRTYDLRRMVVMLDAWKEQIADLQAKARTAGAEQHLVMSGKIAGLRQLRRAYELQMTETHGASAAVFREIQRTAEGMAENFRKLYLQAASRFRC